VFVRGARARAAESAAIVVGAVLVLLFVLTACKTTEDQASRPEESAELARPESNAPLQPAPPVDPPIVAPPDSPREAKPVLRAEPNPGKREDPFAGVEEWVARGPAAEARLLSSMATSAVAFDAYDDSGAGDSVALAPETNLDRYDRFGETGFVAVRDRPLSTFSIDVDTASYSNLRRFLQEGTKPPAGAVRIEEMLNYFRYAIDEPTRALSDDRPIAVDAEIFDAPWDEDHRLVRVAVTGRRIADEALPARNLVLLIDVSGSMDGPDRLPWVKRGLIELVEHLRPEDRVAIVVYAGASGLVLEPTPGHRRSEILAALERLSAGGSTAGAEGIRLAYQVARRHFDPKGINRVVLATDGDFNVGTTSRAELVDLIEQERESGVFLSVLGFGRGNLNDAGMEELADHGNGNYAYVDSPAEARRVLVHEAGATLVTIARDVKIQTEFNPARVQAYRLIGYENRRLADRDFNDDRKDAGDVGAGHQVTALYEIVPTGAPFDSGVDALKYERPKDVPAAARSARDEASGEWLTVKLRYQPPQGGKSRKLERVLSGSPRSIEQASESARFCAAVALFGMLLQDSEYRGIGDYRLVQRLARSALGVDDRGERAEFVRLVALAEELRS
jgi:Ca-activated chloride channel family protein